MVKNIIKEIFIMLLLCLAIVLILSVVFYDYNPINKVVPTTIKYSMPDELAEIKEELETKLISQEEQVIRTYEVTEDEIDLYKKTNYDPGKANPFEVYKVDTNENTNTNNNNSNTTNNNSNTTNKTNTNSTGTLFDDGSTK